MGSWKAVQGGQGRAFRASLYTEKEYARPLCSITIADTEKVTHLLK